MPGMKKIEPIPWKLVHRTLAFLGTHRGHLVRAIISTTAVAIVWFAGPYFLRQLTDTAVAGRFNVFAWMVAGSFVFALLEMGASYMKRISVATISSLAIRDMRNLMTQHIQSLPMTRLQTYHSGDLVSRLNNDLDQTTSLFQRVPDYIHQPLQFIGGLLFMTLISPKLTLVVCGTMPISVLLFERFVRPMQKHSGKKMEALAEVNTSLQEAIRGAPIVRAFNLQGILGSRFRKKVENVEHHDMKNRVRNILAFIPFLALRYIPQLLVPIYGGLLAFRGEITVGGLLAVNWLIWPVFLPLESFLAWIREMREAASALKRSYEILDSPPERTGGQPIVSTVGIDPIVVDAVSFSYDGGGCVLDDLTFRIEQGKTIALVGSSGCGKTTLLKILCGWIEPDRGDARFFGVSLRSADLESLRNQISWMSQDPFLFPTTIGKNISYGRASATQSEIIAAAQAANAHGFISALPKGYDTPAGELGSRLSGGQKQRICLARMILKDAPILLLDEPTAALDTQAEAEVLGTLHRLMEDKTAVMISHRLSSLRGVDEILVIDHGRIRAKGTHHQLVRQDALYQQFIERQAIKEDAGIFAGGAT